MVELTLSVPQALVEPLCDALMDDLGADSVAIEDADADTDAEQALFGEPGMPVSEAAWAHSHARALFCSEEAAVSAATALREEPWAAGITLESIAAVPDQDWVRLTQSQFAPVQITPSFWIVPSWHEPPERAQHIIRLDPGLAFGTGTHPTTRMCLRWLAERAETDVSLWHQVLDYGCGSGVLAIAAKMLGAGVVTAVDIDPTAVSATEANAIANGVDVKAGLPDMISGTYNVVMANILATPLKLLAPLLSTHVAPGGSLVLAGILERQADELTTAYAPWCTLETTAVDEGWVLMSARFAS